MRPLALVLCTLLATTLAAGEARLLFEPGELGTWKIAHGRVESEVPPAAGLRILGRTWSGEERLLFETKAAALPSFEVALWLSDDLSLLSLELETPSGWERVDEFRIPLDSSTEAAALPSPPLAVPSLGWPPGLVEVDAGDPSTFESGLASRVFVTPPPLASALVLLAAFLLALPLAAALGRALRSEGAGLAGGAALCLLAFALAALLLPPRNEVFSVGMDRGGTADLPARRLLLEEGSSAGWATHVWGAESGRRLLGIRPGSPAPLPLEALGGRDSRFRFSSAPVVVLEEGRLGLRFGTFTTAWGSDDGDN